MQKRVTFCVRFLLQSPFQQIRLQRFDHPFWRAFGAAIWGDAGGLTHGGDKELVASIGGLRDPKARAFKLVIGRDDGDMVINARGFFIVERDFTNGESERVIAVP